jgi:hypothetical protein
VVWALNRFKLLGELPDGVEKDTAVFPLVQKALSRLTVKQPVEAK